MTKEQIELCTQLYKKGLSAKTIEKYVPYTAHTILKYIAENGIKIRSKAGYRKPFKENYFESIDTEEKAYLLGYLTADGNVAERQDSQPVVRMELNRKDISVLQLFKKEIDTNIDIKMTRNNCCCIRVHSRKMFDDLSKYGIVPRKTGIEKFPKEQIPDEMIHHFLRGFFDGDGWATITHHGGKKKVVNCGWCGNLKMLTDIRDYLCEKLSCYKIKIAKRHNGSVYHLIYGSRKDNFAIYSFLYHNATCYLRRKKDKFDEFFHANTEQSNHHLTV